MITASNVLVFNTILWINPNPTPFQPRVFELYMKEAIICTYFNWDVVATNNE